MTKKICSCCARAFTRDEWRSLPCVGIQHGDDGERLDLRNCPECGSTLAVILEPEPEGYVCS